MLTLLKNIFNSFDGEKARQLEQEKLEEELHYFEELVAHDELVTEPAIVNSETLMVRENEIEDSTTEDQLKCFKRIGVVTTLNSNNGTIDNALFFDMSVALSVTYEIKVGCQVEYLAYENPKTDHIKVVKLLQVVDNFWDQDMEIEDKIEQQIKELRIEKPQFFNTNQRNILGLIKERKPNAILIDTEYKLMNVLLDSVDIDFVPKEGDRVYVCCNVQEDDHFVDKQGEILEEISVHPARMLKQEKCTVRRVNSDYAELNDDSYVTLDVLPSNCKLNVGDIVSADLIECERGNFIWRCIKLSVLEQNINITPAKIKTDNHPIMISENLYCVFSNTFQSQTLDVRMTNKTERSMKVQSIEIASKRRDTPLRLIDPPPNDTSFELQSNEERILRFELEPTMFGESRESFVVNFPKFFVRRYIRLIVCENEEAAAAERTKQEANKSDYALSPQSLICNNNKNNSRNDAQRNRLYANQVWSKKGEIVPGVGLLTRRRFIAVHIDQYAVPERLRNAYLTAERRLELVANVDGYFPYLCDELQMSNYAVRFQALLHLEEIEFFINFRSYDRERAFFTRDGEYLSLSVENLAEKRPSLAVGDMVNAINPWTTDGTTAPTFSGIIHKVLFDRVLLKFNPGFHSKYKGEDYRLEFHFSRFSFRKQHHAITRIQKHLGEQFLFPSRVHLRERPQLDVQINDEYDMESNGRPMPWFNKELNVVQKRAIYNIMRGEVQRMPYVIFGPPGTGKTITLVETILQVMKHVSGARILVGTPSNSSADLIATRLINSGILQPGDFVRLVSQNSIERDIIPDHLLPYCATPDFGTDGTCNNSMIITDSGLKLRCQMKTLGRNIITISTCTTLGNFIPMGFPADHFTHVFVDEAGQCTEPELMVPISLISKERGQVVLAGDPYQLSAIVTNRLAAERGLSLSYLERITKRTPYVKDMERFPKSSGYDPRLVTKLLNNYRALPSILNVYNELFYDTELLPMVDEVSSREALCLHQLDGQWFSSNLRAKAHGAFFHGTASENKQDADSPSWYNPIEAKNVFYFTMNLYKTDIKPENIGIITPYARQVKQLRTVFMGADMPMPKIGSVEEFQGQERDIILISTVRSTKSLIAIDLRHALGFVQSPKRMNVAISRARYLMFVFGNPHLLALDNGWHTYIKYCIDNDAYFGCDPPDSVLNDTKCNDDIDSKI